MEDVVDTFSLDETGGLFAADAAGAEHGDFRLSALGFEARAEIAEPGGELPEAFRLRINRAFKGADGDFVIVAGVDQNGVRIRNQGVPVFRLHIGADEAVRVSAGHAHGDDFALQAHFEAREGHRLGFGKLRFKALRAV